MKRAMGMGRCKMIRIKTESMDVVLTKNEERVLELALLTFKVPKNMTARGGKPYKMAEEYPTIANFLYHALKRKEQRTELDFPDDYDQTR